MFSLESSLVDFQGITLKANNCFHSSGPPQPSFRACLAHTAAPQRLSQTMENSKIRLLEFLRALSRGRGWVCIQIKFRFGLWLEADLGLEFMVIIEEWKTQGFA